MRFPFVSWLCLTVVLSVMTAVAQTSLPTETGQEIEAYQDGFNALERRLSWIPTGLAGDVYLQTTGVMKVSTGPGDCNHLLLEHGGYDPDVQEVLARIRVTQNGYGDYARGGVGLAVSPGSSQGVNFLFRFWDAAPTASLPNNVSIPEGSGTDGQNLPAGGVGNHVEFLNDLQAWGTEYTFAWQTNTWYWMRFRHEVNAGGGVNDVMGKIWKDGTTEPPAWQTTWDYAPGTALRSGLAGITASSVHGPLDFEVDYILIKAAGLPRMVVGAPEVLSVSIGDGTSFHPATEPLLFSVSAPFTLQSVEVKVNGVAAGAALTSSGSATEKEYRLGLEPGKAYRIEITPFANPTLKGITTVLNFDTFLPRTEIQLLTPKLTAEGFQFRYEPLLGRIHRVEARESLVTGQWVPLPIAEDFQGGFNVVTDAQSGRSRFYRVMAE